METLSYTVHGTGVEIEAVHGTNSQNLAVHGTEGGRGVTPS